MEATKLVQHKVLQALSAHKSLYISDVVVSDISKNIVISFQIDVSESSRKFNAKVRMIIRAIQGLGRQGYGLYLEAHNAFNYTLATMSFSEDKLFAIDFTEDLESYTKHYSVPKRFRE